MRPGPAFAPTPFGLATAATLLAGVLLVQGFPWLPPTAAAVALALAGLFAWRHGGYARPAGAFLLGIGIACLHGQAALSLRLPSELSGQELVLEGQVLGLPMIEADASRFEFRVSQGQGSAAVLVGRKLRLGWYAHPPDTVPEIEPGSRWRLRVKLRPPRGLANPGGFDFERRALEQRIAATGHVRDPESAQRLTPGQGIDALRGRLSGHMQAAVDAPSARFVAADRKSVV